MAEATPTSVSIPSRPADSKNETVIKGQSYLGIKPYTWSTNALTQQQSVDQPGANANANAARSMQNTSDWKPTFDRRPSWSKEEHKHKLQMSAMDGSKQGQGFTQQGI